MLIHFRPLCLDVSAFGRSPRTSAFFQIIIFSLNRPEFSIYNFNMLHVIVICFTIYYVCMCRKVVGKSGHGLPGWFWKFRRTRTEGFENPRFWRTSFYFVDKTIACIAHAYIDRTRVLRTWLY